MITELEIKAYRRAAAAVEKAAAELSAHRVLDDDEGRRLRLVVAELEIERHRLAVALDAADGSVADLDAFVRRAARTYAAAQVPASVPRLESYAVDAVEHHAAEIAATLPKAAEREAAEHAWFSAWSAARSAAEVHSAERRALGLPLARWYVPANPGDWRELLGERPAAPCSASVGIAGALRREMPGAGGFTDRPARARGPMPGDLADARERARAG